MASSALYRRLGDVVTLCVPNSAAQIKFGYATKRPTGCALGGPDNDVVGREQTRKIVAGQIMEFAVALVRKRIELAQHVVRMAWVTHHQPAVREALQEARHQRREIALPTEIIGACKTWIERDACTARVLAEGGAQRIQQQRLGRIETLP